MAGWTDWLYGAASVVSAWGAISGAKDTSDYYTQAAEITKQNAAITKQTSIWAAETEKQKTDWETEEAAIAYSKAGISEQWAEYEYAYKTKVSELEYKYNDYMTELYAAQAAEETQLAEITYAQETETAEETEATAAEAAQLDYDEKMDTLRHNVAETSAKGGASGFVINSGSFLSALKGVTDTGEYYYGKTKELAEETAATKEESSLSSAETTYKKSLLSADLTEAASQKYELAGKINLEEEKLYASELGLSQSIYDLAGETYDIATKKQTYAGTTYSRALAAAENTYGVNMANASLLNERASSSSTAGYWSAASSILNAWKVLQYGKG